MCSSVPVSYDFTENVCVFCKDDEHDDCDDYISEACACRNSAHTLKNPTQFIERFLEGMSRK